VTSISEEHKTNFGLATNFVSGHSTEVSTGITQTDSDTVILFTLHFVILLPKGNLSELFHGGNWCRPVLFPYTAPTDLFV